MKFGERFEFFGFFCEPIVEISGKKGPCPFSSNIYNDVN